MNLLHSYRAWKWLRKMKKEEKKETDWNEYQALTPVQTSHIQVYQRMYDIRFEALKDQYRNTITNPFAVKFATRPHSWNKFGWSYFNKHRGWNWLGGLTKSK